jgi:hypothetical protein
VGIVKPFKLINQSYSTIIYIYMCVLCFHIAVFRCGQTNRKIHQVLSLYLFYIIITSRVVRFYFILFLFYKFLKIMGLSIWVPRISLYIGISPVLLHKNRILFILGEN